MSGQTCGGCRYWEPITDCERLKGQGVCLLFSGRDQRDHPDWVKGSMPTAVSEFGDDTEFITPEAWGCQNGKPSEGAPDGR